NWARYNLAKPMSLTSLAKSAVSIDPAVALQLVVNNESDSWTDTENRPLSLDLRLQEQRPLAGFSYTVHLDPEVFAYKSFEIADSLQGKDHNWLVLHHFDEGTGLLTLDMVKFGETGDDPRPVDQVGRIHTTVLKETAVTLNGLLDVRLANDSTQNYLGRVTYNINTASRAPDAFLLRPNFPNPFTDYTNIQYALPRKSDIRLMIFDLQGEKVRTIFEGTQSPGYYTEVWDGKSDRGIEVSSGMYFLILQTPEQTFRNKMILVK
ncbi:MAG TPA: FlgD immunoglobulin-like domain containing protein, partial [bacterium]|nr:FlgD immunoglobulin-like domain containing protein [bacterium]